MRYKIGNKVIDSFGNKYIIDKVYNEQTPVGDTLFFELRSRKKSIPNQRVTEWMLDTYFEFIS